MESLAETIQAAARAFGMRGDGSLEYIGLTADTEKGRVRSRVYHKRTEAPEEIFEPPFPELLERFAQWRRTPGVRLVDVSEDRPADILLYRLVFALPKNAGEEQQALLLKPFLQAAGLPEEQARRFGARAASYQTNREVLYQIGALFTADGTAEGFKYYYLLSDEAWQRKKDRLPEESRAQFGAVCENGYRPYFSGVNDDGTVSEEKLYFVTKRIGFRTDAKVQDAKAVARALGCRHLLTDETVEEIAKENIYLDGLAVSVGEPGKLRFYFAEQKALKR